MPKVASVTIYLPCHECIAGDQVVDWDGSSLEDATFEEVRQIVSRSGDRVQLTLFRTRHG